MKTLNRIALIAAVIGILAPSAHASRAANEMANICKAEAADQFSAVENPVRVKFKGLYGPRNATRVLLQVLPDEGDSFKAVCKMDSRTGEILSLGKKS